MRTGLVARFRFAVIPAKAGIYVGLFSVAKMDDRPLLRPALRAIGYADVRSGILPSQSGFRRNDDNRGACP
jgi:hypothetical protein